MTAESGYGNDSVHDQQTLPLQIKAMREYAVRRGWRIAIEVKESARACCSGPSTRGSFLSPSEREVNRRWISRAARADSGSSTGTLHGYARSSGSNAMLTQYGAADGLALASDLSTSPRAL
jgi:hypothetical protein